MASLKDQITNAAALNFEKDVQYRTLLQCIPGISAFMGRGDSSDLPMNSAQVCIDMLLETGQLHYALKSELLRQRAGLVTIGYGGRYTITAGDGGQLGAGELFLAFANVVDGDSNPMSRYPIDDHDYEFYRGNMLINGSDVVLVPNSGLMFSTAWSDGEVGQFLVRSSAQRKGTQLRVYYGSSFAGSGNRIANFANIGADIFGNTINPMPTLASQIYVHGGPLLVQDNDYAVSISGGVATVTFTFDVPDDKFVIFKIEAGAA